MKNKRILLISIPVIIIISAVIGCVITFSSAPHAALARVFIDIGALFALVSITYSLPKPEPLHIDDIVDGLRDLARNRFDRRLPIKEQDELHQIRQAFNELAGTLSDSRDPSLTHIRYNPMNRVELKVTPLPNIHHSHHPELGQVKSAADEFMPSARAPAAVLEKVEHNVTEPDAVEPAVETSALSENLEELPLAPAAAVDTMMQEEHPFSATMLGSEPPALESPTPHIETKSEIAPLDRNEPQPEAQPAPQPQTKSTQSPRRPESYPSGIGAADLFFLFERFKAAHEQPAHNTVDFDSFMSTVNKAREDLIRAHQCKDVRFEVVTEAGAVALRPRLIR